MSCASCTFAVGKNIFELNSKENLICPESCFKQFKCRICSTKSEVFMRVVYVCAECAMIPGSAHIIGFVLAFMAGNTYEEAFAIGWFVSTPFIILVGTYFIVTFSFVLGVKGLFGNNIMMRFKDFQASNHQFLEKYMFV